MTDSARRITEGSDGRLCVCISGREQHVDRIDGRGTTRRIGVAHRRQRVAKDRARQLRAWSAVTIDTEQIGEGRGERVDI